MENPFGRLKITEDLGVKRQTFSERSRHMVRCQCTCGANVVVRLDGLKNGGYKSCGCLARERAAAAAKGINRSKVVLGKTYGFVTVLARLENTRFGAATYRCRCECGNVYTVQGPQLTGKRVLRCKKCGNREHLQRLHQQNSKTPGEAACRATYTGHRQTAIKRHLTWEIDYSTWKNLTQKPCAYCGCPPSNRTSGRWNGVFVYSGLDRIDSTKGYTSQNINPACKRCNIAKNDQTVDEFLAWVRTVYAHNQCSMHVVKA